MRDLGSGLLEDARTLSGRKVDRGNLRSVLDPRPDHGLSGGQMQRLAVARTFMRSSSTERGVGLLLFDEPSASLDPTAEHGAHRVSVSFVFVENMAPVCLDLFSRLRELRGNKTMIFSTHRFGNLTRHADLILCVHFCFSLFDVRRLG